MLIATPEKLKGVPREWIEEHTSAVDNKDAAVIGGKVMPWTIGERFASFSQISSLGYLE
jgi:hypothetical protein